MNRHRLLQRFVRYVKIDTTARPDAKAIRARRVNSSWGGCWSASWRPWESADARQDAHGIVLATVPAQSPGRPDDRLVLAIWTLRRKPPARASGRRSFVRYPGGDLTLPGDPSQMIRRGRPAGVGKARGKTIVTSDGTTLLGADDKAGVAVIMETAAWLMEHPKSRRPGPDLFHLR